jgi:hypothetical protein
MKDTPAIYLGNIVDKKYFRTFVYGVNGTRRLVESWDAFEEAMASGLWFATHEDARCRIEVNRKESVKPKQKRAKKVVEDKSINAVKDDSIVELIEDDFLPSEDVFEVKGE